MARSAVLLQKRACSAVRLGLQLILTGKHASPRALAGTESAAGAGAVVRTEDEAAC